MLWQFSSSKVQQKHILCYILHHILDFRLLFRFMTLFAYSLVALQGLNHSCPCLYTVSCLAAWHHEWKQLGSNSTVGSPPCARHRARHLTFACSGGPAEWLYACVFWPIPLPVAEESTAVQILGFYVRKWITGKPTIKAEVWKLVYKQLLQQKLYFQKGIVNGIMLYWLLCFVHHLLCLCIHIDTDLRIECSFIIMLWPDSGKHYLQWHLLTTCHVIIAPPLASKWIFAIWVQSLSDENA